MAILLLEHEGKLSESDRLRDHVPEMDIHPDITIEQLLHHTSGIPDYMRHAIKHKADRELFKTSDLIALFARHEPPLDFRSGTKCQYSNTGNDLLAEIVARAYGQTFEAYLPDNVFKPADMADSQVFNLLSTSEPDHWVFGFKRNGLNRDEAKPNDLNNFDGIAGDGGVYVTARNLHKKNGLRHVSKIAEDNSIYNKDCSERNAFQPNRELLAYRGSPSAFADSSAKGVA